MSFSLEVLGVSTGLRSVQVNRQPGVGVIVGVLAATAVVEGVRGVGDPD